MKCCFRCGSQFLHKSNLTRHLQKKKLCDATYLDIPGTDIINDFALYESQYDALMKRIKAGDVNINLENKIVALDSDYVCEGCGMKFSHKNNYYRHRKQTCKIMKPEYKGIKKFKKKLDMTYRELKKEKNESKVTNNYMANCFNNYNINVKKGSDIINNNHFNITINEYGKETICDISDEEWKQIIKKLYQALPDLVKKIHIDIEANRNVYVPNIREHYAMIYKQNGWKIIDIKDLLTTLLIDNTDRIYDYLEENSQDINRSIYLKMSDIIEKIGSDEKLQKDYQDQIKLILINNRTVIKKYYEQIIGRKLEITDLTT